MPTFEIDPDIRKARTLPADFYADPAFFELSRERVFAASWQFLTHSSRVDDLFPVTMLPGLLDEPLLLVSSDDSIKCMSNVCTHRGKVLVERPCKANLIRCGYHGRRFSLDGKFLSMPEFEDVEDFPSPDDDLRPIPTATKLGFVFGSLGPVVPIEDYVGDVCDALPDLSFDELRHTSTREYEINAHWALYCENYLEGFHIPYVHHGLNSVVDYGTYNTDTFRFSSVQTACDANSAVAARYLFLFPNTMLNFYPWGVSVNVVKPVAPDRTIVEFQTYVGDESRTDTGAGADLHTVEMEDEAVVESVQKGIRSRFYSHGRYSPSREQGTHHFHRLIAQFMG